LPEAVGVAAAAVAAVGLLKRMGRQTNGNAVSTAHAAVING
jgi:hypothetical protein